MQNQVNIILYEIKKVIKDTMSCSNVITTFISRKIRIVKQHQQ